MDLDANTDTARKPSEAMPVYGNPYPDAFSNLPEGCEKVPMPDIQVIDLCDWDPKLPTPDVVSPGRTPVVVPAVPTFSDPCIYIEPKVNAEYTDRKNNKSRFTTDRYGGHSDCMDGRYVMEIDVPIKCPIPESFGVPSGRPKSKDGKVDAGFVGYGEKPVSSVSVKKAKDDCAIEDIQVDLDLPCVYSEMKGAMANGRVRISESYDPPKNQAGFRVSGSGSSEECSLDAINLDIEVPKGCSGTRISGNASLSLKRGPAGGGMPDDTVEAVPYKDVPFSVEEDGECGFNLSLPIEIPVPKVCGTSFTAEMVELGEDEMPYAISTTTRTDDGEACNDMTSLVIGMPSSIFCTPSIVVKESSVEQVMCDGLKPSIFIKTGDSLSDGGPMEKLSGVISAMSASFDKREKAIRDGISQANKMPNFTPSQQAARAAVLESYNEQLGHLSIEKRIFSWAKTRASNEAKRADQRCKNKGIGHYRKYKDEDSTCSKLAADQRYADEAKECGEELCNAHLGANGSNQSNFFPDVSEYTIGSAYGSTYSGKTPEDMYKSILAKSGCSGCSSEIPINVYMTLPLSAPCEIPTLNSSTLTAMSPDDFEKFMSDPGNKPVDIQMSRDGFDPEGNNNGLDECNPLTMDVNLTLPVFDKAAHDAVLGEMCCGLNVKLDSVSLVDPEEIEKDEDGNPKWFKRREKLPDEPCWDEKKGCVFEGDLKIPRPIIEIEEEELHKDVTIAMGLKDVVVDGHKYTFGVKRSKLSGGKTKVGCMTLLNEVKLNNGVIEIVPKMSGGDTQTINVVTSINFSNGALTYDSVGLNFKEGVLCGATGNSTTTVFSTVKCSESSSGS